MATIFFFYSVLRLLGSKVSIASLVRVLGFSQTAYYLEVLAFIPAIKGVAIGTASVLSFIAAVVGTSAASRLKGWRAVAIPVVALVFVLLHIYFLQLLLSRLGITLLELLARMGIISIP